MKRTPLLLVVSAFALGVAACQRDGADNAATEARRRLRRSASTSPAWTAPSRRATISTPSPMAAGSRRPRFPPTAPIWAPSPRCRWRSRSATPSWSAALPGPTPRRAATSGGSPITMPPSSTPPRSSAPACARSPRASRRSTASATSGRCRRRWGRACAPTPTRSTRPISTRPTSSACSCRRRSRIPAATSLICSRAGSACPTANIISARRSR